MKSEGATAIRNVGFLLVQRVLKILQGLLFLILVPRLLGPDRYGLFRLLMSLCLWFIFATSMGLVPVFSRFLPQLTLEKKNLKDFFEPFLTVRLLVALSAALLYSLFIFFWLKEVDLWVLLPLGGLVFFQSLSQLFFSFFLGVNRAALWGMGELLRAWTSLPFLLTGFYLADLKGACLGLLLSEGLVLIVGICWTRPYLSWPRPRLNFQQLMPYLKFGAYYYASDLLFTAFQFSGEPLIRLFSGDYREIAYFGLAFHGYQSAGLLLFYLPLAFLPFFSSLILQGQTEALREWVERLLTWLSIGGVLLFWAVLLLGPDLVPFVVGPGYDPVIINLVPMALTFLIAILGSMSHILSQVLTRPELALRAAALRVLVFWGISLPLITWRPSLGGCLAVLIAAGTHSFYFNWSIQKIFRYHIRSWGIPLALGTLFLPFYWLQSSFMINVGLYVLFAFIYLFVLIRFNIMRTHELTAAWRIIHQKGS